MKKYLIIVLLLGVCLGQEEKDTADKKEISKVRCRECFLPMKETINAYVCRDNHMRIEKSDLKIGEDGTYIVQTDTELDYERIRKIELNRLQSLEDHLYRAGDNLRLYYFKTIVGSFLTTGGMLYQTDLALKGKSLVTPYLITLTGIYYSISAFKHIDTSGKELRKASKAITKEKENLSK